MVLSIRDRDKGRTVHVISLEEETNAESIKQLEEPESNNPKNGQAVSREWKVARRNLELGVLAAPNFKLGSWEMLRQSPPQGKDGLLCSFLGVPIVRLMY